MGARPGTAARGALVPLHLSGPSLLACDSVSLVCETSPRQEEGGMPKAVSLRCFIFLFGKGSASRVVREFLLGQNVRPWLAGGSQPLC